MCHDEADFGAGVELLKTRLETQELSLEDLALLELFFFIRRGLQSNFSLNIDEVAEFILFAIPQPSACDADILPMKGVVIDGVDAGGEALANFMDRVPPVVVVAFDHHFRAGQGINPFEVGEGVFEVFSPGYIASKED